METKITKVALAFGLALLCSFSQHGYAKTPYEKPYVLKRTIHNNSGVPWVVVGQPCSSANKIVFDNGNTQGTVLQPGFTTDVSYELYPINYGEPHCGKLIFSDASKLVSLGYKTMDRYHKILLMSSPYWYLVVDAEGNITINSDA